MTHSRTLTRRAISETLWVKKTSISSSNSINWGRTDKSAYLSALSQEIETPDKGILDAYLKDFIEPPVGPDAWEAAIHSVRGLNGLVTTDTIEGRSDDPAISRKYQEFDQRRGYTID